MNKYEAINKELDRLHNLYQEATKREEKIRADKHTSLGYNQPEIILNMINRMQVYLLKME